MSFLNKLAVAFRAFNNADHLMPAPAGVKSLSLLARGGKVQPPNPASLGLDPAAVDPNNLAGGGNIS